MRHHWKEDPTAFLHKVVNRYCGTRGRRIFTEASRFVPTWVPGAAAAHLALLGGDTEEIGRRLQSAFRLRSKGRTAKHLADIALAAGQADMALAFIKNAGDSVAGVDLSRARIQWQQGHMTQAQQTLASIPQGTSRTIRLQNSYAAESDVFTSWKPELPAVENYEPRDQVVLHLLTNSLPHTQTGYTHRSQSMLAAQAEAGWTVHAVTRLGYPWAQGVHGANAEEILGLVTYHRLPVKGGMPNPRERLQLEAERLLDLVVSLRPQILHTTTHFVNALVVSAVAAAVGIPWVYEVRGQLADTWASKNGPHAVDSERYQRWNARESETIRHADLVLTLGEAMRSRIGASGIDPSGVVLVPNAVGRPYLSEPIDPLAAREALGLDKEATYVGTVSSIVEYEGLDDLVEAFAQLHAGHPDLRLLIAGDGPELPHLRRRISELGLDSAAHFPGKVPREDAVLYHRALDVFAVPRRDYAVTRSVTPLKPVEAMAMERPVVASDLEALREMVVDHETGLLVRPGDPNDLARAISLLLGDKDLRNQLGTHGREEVLRTRTWEANAARTLEAYGILLNVNARATVEEWDLDGQQGEA